VSNKRQLERRAARAFRLKDYERAIGALSDLLDVVGENPHTLHVLAICHQRSARQEQAIPFAERGVAADPAHPGCLQALAELYSARGDEEKAGHYARRALKLLSAGEADLESRQGLIQRLAGVFRRSMGAPGRNTVDREWARWARALLDGNPGVGKE
jgi:tetratricopeptide (TPR) repeat protein